MKFHRKSKVVCDLFYDVKACEVKLNLLHKHIRVHQDAETCVKTVVGLKFNASELFDIINQLTVLEEIVKVYRLVQ